MIFMIILRIVFCVMYQIHNKLQPRILKKGEVKPPDYDEFVQCYECGNIYPIYQSYPETEIKDSEETVKTPFENESVFTSTRKRKRKNRLRMYQDEDIQRELDKGILLTFSNF
jgi:hypothetical protein